MKVEWKKGRVYLTPLTGFEIELSSEYAVGLGQALSSAGASAWTSAFAVPHVATTERRS